MDAPFNPNKQYSKIFLTIDINLDILQEAINECCGMIILYHPHLFDQIKRLNRENPKHQIIMRCVSEGISIYSPHTTLDNCVGGINEWIAKGVGSGKTEPVL